MTQEELNNIAIEHATWLKDTTKGTYASFTSQDFTGLNFDKMDFTRANFVRCLFLRCDMNETNFTAATLLNSNFTDARLTNAILTKANLEGVIGNTREIKSLQVVRFPITYTSTTVQIGCKQCPIENIDDEFNKIIKSLGGKYSNTWDKYKQYLETLLQISPAVKTF